MFEYLDAHPDIDPRELVLQAPSFRREMQNLYVPHKAYANVCGSDLIRQPNGEFAVLEDNLRVPSGVSYMLANREASKRVSAPSALMSARRALSRPAAGDSEEHGPDCGPTAGRGSDAGRLQQRLL
jgi:hypothetical protein